MTINLMKSIFSLTAEKKVAVGYTVANEGLLLIASADAAGERVRVCDGTGSGEVPVGWSLSDNETVATVPEIETGVIPAVSPYTIQLLHGSLYSANGSSPWEMRVTSTEEGIDFAQNGGVADDQYSSTVGGLVTFNSADAGQHVTIYYRRNLTVEESRLLFFQRNINNTAGALFNQVGVGGGDFTIMTQEYDTSADFSTGTLKTLAGGKVTMGGSGTDISSFMRVVKLPSAADKTLGLTGHLRPGFSLPPDAQ